MTITVIQQAKWFYLTYTHTNTPNKIIIQFFFANSISGFSIFSMRCLFVFMLLCYVVIRKNSTTQTKKKHSSTELVTEETIYFPFIVFCFVFVGFASFTRVRWHVNRPNITVIRIGLIVHFILSLFLFVIRAFISFLFVVSMK